MKKIIFTIIAIFAFKSISAQDLVNLVDPEQWTTSIGIMAVPQMGTNLKNPENGFTNHSDVFVVTNFSKEKNSFTAFYSASNATGIAFSRSFSDKYGSYVVANKFVFAEGGYTGIGFTRFVGNVSVFIEVGTLWNEWAPGMYVGAFIPFTFKI